MSTERRNYVRLRRCMCWKRSPEVFSSEVVLVLQRVVQVIMLPGVVWNSSAHMAPDPGDKKHEKCSIDDSNFKKDCAPVVVKFPVLIVLRIQKGSKTHT